MSQQLSILKPKTAIEKRTSTTVDTIMVTAERLSKWKLPSGQRPLTENNKVRTLALQIKEDGGVIPGVLTIGVLEGAKYIIDGQHRLHAFTLSGCTEGYADVRFLHAQSMSDINREFVELNSKLVTMRPDDFLRGLEGSLPALQRIRQACPFVGYDQIRRGTSSPIVSMSATIRNWRGSSMETPTGLMSVSADTQYQDWLLGRHMGERDRSPAYARLKAAFSKRLEIELGKKVQLPAPDWSNT